MVTITVNSEIINIPEGWYDISVRDYIEISKKLHEISQSKTATELDYTATMLQCDYDIAFMLPTALAEKLRGWESMPEFVNFSKQFSFGFVELNENLVDNLTVGQAEFIEKIRKDIFNKYLAESNFLLSKEEFTAEEQPIVSEYYNKIETDLFERINYIIAAVILPQVEHNYRYATFEKKVIELAQKIDNEKCSDFIPFGFFLYKSLFKAFHLRNSALKASLSLICLQNLAVNANALESTLSKVMELRLQRE